MKWFDDLILEIPEAATEDFTQGLIDRYESDQRKRPALIGPGGETVKTIRDSLNLEMNLLPDWAPVVDELRSMLFSRLPEYLDTIHCGHTKSLYRRGYDSSYSLLKYVPGSVGYTWHNDFMMDDFSDRNGVRTVTWLFYLNDCDGGETEFKWGRKIKAERGKLVFFPSSWTYVHRGCPVHSGAKYLCVGWFYSEWNLKFNKN